MWPVDANILNKSAKQAGGEEYTPVSDKNSQQILIMILMELRKINFQLSTFTEITLDDGEF